MWQDEPFCKAMQIKSEGDKLQTTDLKEKSNTKKCASNIRQSDLRETGHTSSSDEAYVYVVNTTKPANLPQTTVTMIGTQTLVLIDSGATANCISESTYNKLVPRPTLTPTESLTVCGEFKATVRKQSARFLSSKVMGSTF